jgi:isoamylase
MAGPWRPPGYRRDLASGPGENTAQAMKSVVADLSRYDWQGDQPLQRPFAQTIIYELHVGGFTRHPNSGVPPEKRGNFSGLMEKIPYLKNLWAQTAERHASGNIRYGDIGNFLREWIKAHFS